MRTTIGLLTALLTAGAVTAAAPPGTPPEVLAAAQRYYAKGDLPEAWLRALDRPNRASEAEARQAAHNLRALLAQAAADERRMRQRPDDDAASDHQSPGSLRSTIVHDLQRVEALRREAWPVLEWLVEEEWNTHVLHQFAETLGRLECELGERARRRIAAKPHENVALLVAVLEQWTRLRRKIPVEQLEAMLRHHRPSVRRAALALNRSMGRPTPKAFDVVRAMRSPPVRRVVRQIGALLPECPPLRAPLVVVSEAWFDENGAEAATRTTTGWLLAEKKDEVTIWTFSGKQETLRKPDAAGKENGIPDRWVMHRLTVEQMVRRVERIRAANDPEGELTSFRVGVCIGPDGHAAAEVPEALLAWWLHRRGDVALAGRVLLPALDTFYRDADLLDVLQASMGDLDGQGMIRAFIDRDYPRTAALARRLLRLYPHAGYSEVAVRMLAELPRRRDDFGNLRLPTPRQWQTLRAEMSRAEQIDYLCRRLRLLNHGPGDCTEAQYAEPPTAAKRTEVINPVVELTATLGVGVADLPLLAEHLRDNWYVLAWSMGGVGFSPATTRQVLAEVINSVAGRDVCRCGKWHGRPEKEQRAHVERIIRWAKGSAQPGGSRTAPKPVSLLCSPPAARHSCSRT